MEFYNFEKLFPNGSLLYNQNLLDKLLTLSTNKQVSGTLYQNRLDLLSYDYYGTVELWWALAYYNKIKNPMEFDITTLSLPNKEELINLIREYIDD